jgi:hypothetical protein
MFLFITLHFSYRCVAGELLLQLLNAGGARGGGDRGGVLQHIQQQHTQQFNQKSPRHQEDQGL